MAIHSDLIERLRYVIGDLDATAYLWTDAQLAKFLTVAASFVSTDMSGFSSVLGGPYTTDLSTPDISPDPMSSSPDGFANLTIAKAACIISTGEYKRDLRTAGWKVVDDKSTIDGTKALEAAKNTSEAYCQAYYTIRDDFKAGNYNSGSAILAVLSPYASSNGSSFRTGLWGGSYR